MFRQHQAESVAASVPALRLPLHSVQKGFDQAAQSLRDEFGDSPRDQVLAYLELDGLPLQSTRPPALSIEKSSDASPQDEFEDSPRDKVLAYLDGDDSASPWRCREVPHLPTLLSAPRAQVLEGRKGTRKVRRQGFARRRCDGDSSGQETPSTDATEATAEPAAAPAEDANQSPGPSRSESPSAAQTASMPEAPTGAGDEGKDAGSAAVNWPEDATTVMLRNIPNRYTVEELVAEMLAAGFEGRFDFFYLPIDFTTKRSRGYAFINFRTAPDAKRFVGAFHGQRLTRYATQKILEVSPAITQGLDANIKQFVKKDAQRIQNPWFRPMIFHGEGEDRALAQTVR